MYRMILEGSGQLLSFWGACQVVLGASVLAVRKPWAILEDCRVIRENVFRL